MPTLEWLYRGTGDTVDPLTAAPVAFGSHGIALVVTQQSVAAQRPQWKAPTFEGPAGQAALTVRFPSGQPYDRDHRVWVERVDDGEVVVAPDFELWDTIPWTHVTLPPGRYRATASSEEHAPMCGTGWRPRLPPYGDAVVEFDVAAGQRTHADLIFAEGGRLRLALPVQGLPKDPLSSKALRCCSSNDFAAAARGPGSGTVVAVHADGTRTPLWFCAPRLLSVYSFPGIIPGTECLSRTVLPPGKYTLIVDVPGYQAAEVHTQVTAGEIRRVEVRLR